MPNANPNPDPDTPVPVIAAPPKNYKEILFEQFEDLLRHDRGHCPKNCRDCLRLKQIQLILLMPFKVKEFQWH